MEEKKCFYLAVFGMLILGVLSGHDGEDMPVLNVNCSIRYIVQNQPYTVQEACGGKINVTVYGFFANVSMFPDDSFPWQLEASVIAETKSSVIINIADRASLTNGDDITPLIQQNTDTVIIQGGTCENRDAIAEMRLTSTVGTYTQEYVTRSKIRVMCDFSGIDLTLTPSMTLDPVPEITIDTANPSLSAAMANEDFNFMVSAGTAGDTELPALVPSTAGYFAVAYITAYNSSEILTQEACQQAMSVGQKPHLPAIKYGDQLVGSPVFFQTLAELQAADLLGMAKQFTDDFDACGDHVLVLMLDPMHTAWNEADRCNNFLAFKVISDSCPNRTDIGMVPQCEAVRNPWTEDGGTRFIYRGVNKTSMPYKPDVRMFQYEHGWKMTPRSRGGDWAEVEGYGRLMILQAYFESQYDPSSCDIVDNSTAAMALGELEGTGDSAGDTNTQLPAQYTLALDAVARLKTTPSDASTIMGELDDAIGNLPMPINGTVSMLEYSINRFALEAARNLTEKVAMSDMMTMEEFARVVARNACNIGEILSNARYEMHAARAYGDMPHRREMLLYAASQIVRALVHFKYFYPSFTCLENILRGLVNYGAQFQQVESAVTSPYEETILPEAEFLFNLQDVEHMKATKGDTRYMEYCFPASNCIEKLRGQCQMDSCVDMGAVSESSEDICKMRAMKNMVMEQYQALGLIDIRDKLLQNDDCWSKDPLKPRKGPVTLWQTKDDPTLGHMIYRGSLSLDNRKICWKPKATCTCQSCDAGGDTVSDMKRKKK